MWRVWLVAVMVLAGLLTQVPARVPEVGPEQAASGEPAGCRGGTITCLSSADLAAVVWGADLPPPVPVVPQSSLARWRLDDYGSYRRMLH